jgi:NAD(P)-dependent dehydrogenase (short-subunit alcohol dehydrogenase family)
MNLSAGFYLAHHVVPAMKARGWGRIIHVSGYDGFTGHLTNRAYNIAAKAGLHGFSKALAKELGPFGITANTLVPGAIDTERDWSQYPKTTYEALAKIIPVRRWGHVDDLAHACVYLCTTGSFVNGQALHLNGGEFMF